MRLLLHILTRPGDSFAREIIACQEGDKENKNGRGGPDEAGTGLQRIAGKHFRGGFRANLVNPAAETSDVIIVRMFVNVLAQAPPGLLGFGFKR